MANVPESNNETDYIAYGHTESGQLIEIRLTEIEVYLFGIESDDTDKGESECLS